MDTMAEKPAEPQKPLLAKFKVLCETKFGETVWLVGSIPELQSWDVKNAIELRPVNYTLENPVWESIDLVLPLDVQIEYKFFKIGYGEKTEWEQLPHGVNHSVTFTFGESVEILQAFGSTTKQIEVKKGDRSHLYSEDSKEPSAKPERKPAARKFTMVLLALYIIIRKIKANCQIVRKKKKPRNLQ